MKKLIVVADLANDSLSCQEIKIAVEGFLKDPTVSNISFVSSTPSTIHTGFIINQLVQIEERFGHPLETVIFQNTDPRMQSKEAVEASHGAEFIILHLKSGIYLCGPNAGYDFSMVKDQIEEAFVYKGLEKGSQFRSRDLYSRVCAHLMDAMEDELELEELHLNTIPGLQDFYIGHIDNFGNLKTTITVEDFKGKFSHGDIVSMKINKVEKKVKYVSNLFGGKPGELVVYPGSSGKKDNPFLEVTVWRHFIEEDTTTGVHAFNNAVPGMKVEFT